jgi:C4-dicarboxylate transporter DctM subunit
MISLLFITLGICLLCSVPVSFSIGIAAFVFLFTSEAAPMSIMVQRMFEGVDSFPIMALPLFVLSGELMASSCTPRLMRLANLLIGKVPGGLAATTTIGCGFFGAISGSGVATTAAIGGVMEPEMIKAKYAPGFVASLTCGAGVLGMIIPPSFCMVIYGASGGVSIAKLFLGGVIPGILAVGLLVAYSIFIGSRRGYRAAVVVYKPGEKLKIFFDALLPLVMPIIILGGVLSGLVTPTESAMIAVLYAIILETLLYRALSLSKFIKICSRSAVSSAIIMFIMATAAAFGWLMATESVPKMFAQAILNFTTSPYAVYFLIMALLLILGTFMESVSIIILVTPILLPIAVSFGMDPVHFGIALMMAVAIGGVTPPLAVGLFVATRIIGCRVEDSFPEILHVIAILSTVLALTFFIPALSLYLPQFAISG